MRPIYVDMDDVLSDSTSGYLEIVEREFDKKVAFEQLHSFDLQESFGLTDEEFDHLFKVLHDREVILSFPPMAGASQVLSAWIEMGYEIAVVTGRPTSAYEASLAWLAAYDMPFHSFTMVDKYGRPQMDSGIALTLDELAKMQFSFAVEDSMKMARFLANTMNTPVALMDRPWNRNGSLNGHIKRFNAWEQIGAAYPGV